MRIALFLPHVGVFGSVRRFIELGNVWARAGHAVTLYHPSGTPPEWLPFAGQVEGLTRAASEPSELALCADGVTLEAFLAHPSSIRLYYCVIEGDSNLDRVARIPVRRVATRLRRPVIDGVGGIDLHQFHPDLARRGAVTRVLLNGRRSRAKKGTDLILRALSPLATQGPAFEVVLFDTVSEHNRQDPRDGAPLPPNARFVLGSTQDELAALYQSSHVFVAAERKA